MISTVIDQSLGLEFPIFQGGMAWVADASLAAGVSNAGGLGLIAAMNSNGEQLRAEIKKCKELTDKPFGVNIMLMSPFADEVADVAELLMSERAQFITGATFLVDGGATASYYYGPLQPGLDTGMEEGKQ